MEGTAVKEADWNPGTLSGPVFCGLEFISGNSDR